MMSVFEFGIVFCSVREQLVCLEVESKGLVIEYKSLVCITCGMYYLIVLGVPYSMLARLEV